MRTLRACPKLLAVLLLAPFALVAGCLARAPEEGPAWEEAGDRVWIGPDFWANRLQDWRLRGGRVECIGTSQPMRTLHRTTVRVGLKPGTLLTRVRLGVLDGIADDVAPDAAAGLLIGAGAPQLDWRAACLVQSGPGPGGGWFCGVTADGRLFVRDNSAAPPKEGEEAEAGRGAEVAMNGSERLGDVELVVRVEPNAGWSSTLVAEAFELATGRSLGQVRRENVDAAELAGNLALVSHPAKGGTGLPGRFWFDGWTAVGSRLEEHEDRTVGPILSAMHTLSGGVLKLTAQMMPVGVTDPRSVVLEVKQASLWVEVARAPIAVPSFTASFRVEDWDDRRNVDYRLVYGDQELSGTVRRDPVDKQEIVLAGLSCNHNNRFGFGKPGYPWDETSLWFPHNDTVRHVRSHKPDLYFFAGDQIYEGASPTPPDRKGDPELDYLYKWYLFCWAFGDLARDVPFVTVPDDHDVFQGNLWGHGGRAAKRDNQGGYVMPADWVRMVEETQTSHLPDPFDPTPVDQDIGVYYTNLVYGRVGFAVLEDRKFKSGCSDLELGGPRPDHVVDEGFDPSLADAEGKELLGERQLAFLEAWAGDWSGQEMKVALSQTVFANVATHHGARQDRLVADLDSNGWPQAGRNRALRGLRRAFALHVAGDQHLATLVHHGVDDWNDATWSFTVPAIANFYARAWRPEGPPEVALPDRPPYAGSRFDGLGNRVTVWAAANADGPMGIEPAVLHDQMPGYGIVRVDKPRREFTVECWPRGVDPGRGRQYEGWPKTIPQRDCYGRPAEAWLPELVVEGSDQPVVQVFTEDGELVYALRTTSDRFQPWVFELGTYLVRVGDPEAGRWTELKLASFGETNETVRVPLR
ncbi:MAG: alkaline phosphatase D family protein [Planctomycetota bacterium]